MRFLVDTLTSLVFFTIVATISERWVAGLGWDQILTARLAAIPAMLITARPYGVWRDYVMRASGLQTRGRVWRTILDTVAFISFQVPVYAATLALAGASWAQMLAAISTAIVFMICLSRLFGLVLDKVRSLAFGPLQVPGASRS